MMRNWIKLFEGYEQEIDSGYDLFLEIWIDHSPEDDFLEEEKPSLEKYKSYAFEIVEHATTQPLYRAC